jgi:HSP20 family molecular chaperone IbpA
VLVVYCLITSPLLLIVIAAAGGLSYFASTKNNDRKLAIAACFEDTLAFPGTDSELNCRCKQSMNESADITSRKIPIDKRGLVGRTSLTKFKQEDILDNNMVETRVPMTLREQFLQDPFFNSSLTDMKKVRDDFFQQSQDMRKMFEERSSNSMLHHEKKGSEVNDSIISRDWVMPRKWMMPSMLKDTQDTNLISMKDDDSKMEISLNTAGYKPSDLEVNVVDNEISIEGKHEEKSEAGHTMLSRQFKRTYNLPDEAKLAEVESNLSQDGVLVITVPKEKRIEEVKELRRSKMETKEVNQNSAKSSESVVPMTMRDSFFDDPFFKENWLEIESSQKNFFEESQKRFEESWKSMQSDIDKQRQYSRTLDDKSFLKDKDSNVIRMVNDDSKLEVSLDTSGYKPDELKVTAGRDMICVEGKHEEKSEAGQVMVSRQFSRKYSMPANAKVEEVVSNLSQDGVLVISVPKGKYVETHRPVQVTVQ